MEGVPMSTDPVRRANLAAIECDRRPQLPEGFRRTSSRVGAALGADHTGLSVYELPPGQAVSPYHYEEPAEEWLLVVSGVSDAAAPRRRGAARTVGHRFLPSRPIGGASRTQQQRVHRPRCDVLIKVGSDRSRRQPGQRHGLDVDCG